MFVAAFSPRIRVQGEITMDIQSRLRKRILVATLGVTVATGANAFPRLAISVTPQPIAPWSDPANPLSDYGLQTFSKSVYRPSVDELLDRKEQAAYELLYRAGTQKLVGKSNEVAKATLLAYGILDIATELGDDAPAKAFSAIREHISEFKSDPDRISQHIAQHLLETDQVFISEDDTDVVVSPPETRLGAKAALENLQLRIMQQELTLRSLEHLFTRLANEEIEPTKSQVVVEMGHLLQVLEACPDASEAFAALYNTDEEDLDDKVSLRR